MSRKTNTSGVQNRKEKAMILLKEPFNKILSKKPMTTKSGTPFYGCEHEGDQFNEDDVASWTTGGFFTRRWNDKGSTNEYRNEVYIDLCTKAARLNLPIIDIASGPGLGLIPDIFSINPQVQALVTDACPILIENWKEFLRKNEPDANIQFACFNAADMPVKSDSIDVITSNIGLSSLRYAGDDQMIGLKETYRVLKPGGYLFTVENEHEDKTVVQKVFDRWGRENWFMNNKLGWRDRFKETGYIIEQEKQMIRRVEKDDWELGEVAASFGLEIVVVFKAFVLRKPVAGTK